MFSGFTLSEKCSRTNRELIETYSRTNRENLTTILIENYNLALRTFKEMFPGFTLVRTLLLIENYSREISLLY